MGSKITIDGKEYTQRVIQSLEINGATTPNNLIDATSINNNYIVEVNINTGEEVRIATSEEDVKIQSIEEETIEEELKPIERVESKSLVSRFIDFIKNIFKR